MAKRIGVEKAIHMLRELEVPPISSPVRYFRRDRIAWV